MEWPGKVQAYPPFKLFPIVLFHSLIIPNTYILNAYHTSLSKYWRYISEQNKVQPVGCQLLDLSGKIKWNLPAFILSVQPLPINLITPVVLSLTSPPPHHCPLQSLSGPNSAITSNYPLSVFDMLESYS